MTRVSPLHDSGSRSGLYVRQQAGDVITRLEHGCHGQIPIEVNVGNILEARSSKLLEEPGLPHLPCTVEDEGLASRGLLPIIQLGHEVTVHQLPTIEITSLFWPIMVNTRT